MPVVYTILSIIFRVIEIYLLFNCLYILFYAIAGLFNRKPAQVEITRNRKFCILIPAYKEDVVIIDVASKAVNHAYDGEKDVYVIADSLQPETLVKLQGVGAKVIEVKFEKSTKAKALAVTMGQLADMDYDIGLILDADNIMGKGFLKKVNAAFEAGAIVLQGHRVAKNVDTTFALLDACNEEVNNHLFRKAHYNIGLSSALIGSGMAFEWQYMKRLLNGIELVIAEDKEMDIRTAKDRVKIVFLNDAYVYDEKISNSEVFTKQRSRWIFSQLESLKLHFGAGVSQLFRYGNVDLFDKVIQLALLPRTLLLGALGFMFVLSFFNPFGYSVLFNLMLVVMACAALLLSVPRKYYNAQLWNAIVKIPSVIFYMVLAVLRAGKVKKNWNHTPHTAANHNIDHQHDDIEKYLS